MKKKTNFSARFLGREISERAKWTSKRELDIRDRIQELIATSGLNQSNVAEKMGTSRSIVSEWLSGKRKITHKTLAKFEETFEVQLWGLYERPVIQRVAVDASLLKSNGVTIGISKENKNFQASSFNAEVLQP